MGALTAALFVISAPVHAQLFVFQVEGGQVAKQDTYVNPVWDTVNLQFSYASPIIFAIANSNGAHPADFRIRNITGTSFELTLAEPPSEDGPHVAMNIAYVAMEQGQWSLPDGQQMAAGRVTTNATVHKGGGGFTTVALPPGFTNPIVIAQLQGQANETGNIPAVPSNPWLTVAVQNVTATSFDVALEGSECTLGGVPLAETIGWMAIDGGVVSSFIDSDGFTVEYETIATPPIVPGWDQGAAPVFFGGGYSATPLFVARLQTRNEDDGGWARFLNLSATGVSLRVDEDRCLDGERIHANEEAGLFVFSQSFRIQDPDPDMDGIASSIDNCAFIFNPGQADDDGDGLGNVCDNCPSAFNPQQQDVDQDGLGNACDCGDAFVFPTEGCDDGNTSTGDGCTPSCTVESGWTCSGSPSVCVPICGDGRVLPGEGCDDANTISGDGCSAVCVVEPGYTCVGEPSDCFATCGDGQIANVEGCDDGNTASGDGCDPTCMIEPGWSCTGQPSVCTPGCGDGIVAGSEGCDDGNLVDGDGCSSTCQLEDVGTGGMGGAGGARDGGFGGDVAGGGGFGGDATANRGDGVYLNGRACGCALPGRAPHTRWWLLIAGAAAFALRRVRRRAIGRHT